MTLSRAHDIVSAKANKALDSAENPNEILDYSYQQMLDQGRRPAI
jgi:phage shock protein A